MLSSLVLAILGNVTECFSPAFVVFSLLLTSCASNSCYEGGHRASANALRDAFDILYPGKIECDIVDLYTDYGNKWPYTDYPALYKIAAKYSFLWAAFYEFGCTPFGLWLNEFLQGIVCFDSFRECLNRPSGSTSKRADMVLSVHPLCQDIPLKALADLDTNGASKKPTDKKTPFVTVVTDLGGVSLTRSLFPQAS